MGGAAGIENAAIPIIGVGMPDGYRKSAPPILPPPYILVDSLSTNPLLFVRGCMPQVGTFVN
jgi:hypothetical protein